MSEKIKIEHPKICFGISQHCVIIPLKVTMVTEVEDGCFEYEMAINHPNPSNYMKCHYKADFQSRLVTKDSPLCDKYAKIRLTIEEAKEFVITRLNADRDAAMMKVNGINERLAGINADIAELEAAINN